MGTVPFAFVALPPTQYSPAEDAGLLAGDAILRFGTAYKLEHVPAQIRSGQTVSLAIVEASGRQLEKHVVPRIFDQRNPRSLLGCQIVDACPLEFVPHPALKDYEAKLKNGRNVLQKRAKPDGPAAAQMRPRAVAKTPSPAAAPAPASKRRAVDEAAGGAARPVAVEVPGGEPLLPNWRAAKDGQGRLYFFCALTGEVSWHKPRRAVA